MEKRLSGFPEWLPEQELVQQNLIGTVRRCFQLHGFVPLHLRSVELLSKLSSQGDTSKEIYALKRSASAADEGSGGEDGALGLHYDLTLPFARYVVENEHQLQYPFRRFQIQPAWRGERPQLGRYREFIQADADVINNGPLAVRHDAEMIALLVHTISSLGLPPVKIFLNNRKVLEGFYRGIEVQDIPETLRIVDKLPKIGAEGVQDRLARLGLQSNQTSKILMICEIEKRGRTELVDAVQALGVHHDLLDEGLSELALMLDACGGGNGVEVVAALHIARGFDYYTGTVVEGILRDHPSLGAICSGGRYDRLAEGSRTSMPGMGISIGITRIMAFLQHLGLITARRRSPADVLVVVHSNETRDVSNSIAKRLRSRDVACLVSDSAATYGKQIRVAEQLGIPYVWFPAAEGRPDSVKGLRTGNQEPADADVWLPAIGQSSAIS